MLVRQLVAVALMAAFFVCAPVRADDRVAVPVGVRCILFLGDSITYGGAYVSDIEAYFMTRYPDRQIEFINVGLPSETVSGLSEPGHAGGKFPRPDLHERLGRVLEKTKPDLVFACYGMNDGIYLPLDEERFERFREGMEWLHQQVTAAGAKIVHVTPPTYDPMKGSKADYNMVLDKYSDWLLRQRVKGWDVVDLHRPMNRYLAERREKDPKFFISGDGVHPNELGHWIMAKQILLHLGGKDIENAPDAQAMVAAYPHGADILKLVEKRQGMMKDAWLTATGHKRPGMKLGLPLDEATRKSEEMEKQIRKLAK
jgi:lysophospholipase L1-like esterase